MNPGVQCTSKVVSRMEATATATPWMGPRASIKGIPMEGGVSLAWRLNSKTPQHSRLRLEYLHKFKASLGYTINFGNIQTETLPPKSFGKVGQTQHFCERRIIKS